MTPGTPHRLPSLGGARVLVVEDSRTMAALYRELLRGAGVKNVCEATNVANALEECRAHHPDVAIVDYELEDMSGIDFIRLIRTAADSPAPNMPMVVVSAHGERRIVEEAVGAGADAFVIKPVSALQLVQRLKSAMSKRGCKGADAA